MLYFRFLSCCSWRLPFSVAIFLIVIFFSISSYFLILLYYTKRPFFFQFSYKSLVSKVTYLSLPSNLLRFRWLDLSIPTFYIRLIWMLFYFRYYFHFFVFVVVVFVRGGGVIYSGVMFVLLICILSLLSDCYLVFCIEILLVVFLFSVKRL